jgi:hypothetical protein
LCFGAGNDSVDFKARRSRPWQHALVAPSTGSSRVTGTGIVLLGAGVVANTLHFAGLVALLPGLLLCVSGAALAASRTGPVARPRDDSGGNGFANVARSATITASVLGGVILLPFAATGGLVLAGAEPLAIILVGLGLFALAGILTVTFLVVFFANAWLGGRREGLSSPVD